jgi:hypothetical protein
MLAPRGQIGEQVKRGTVGVRDSCQGLMPFSPLPVATSGFAGDRARNLAGCAPQVPLGVPEPRAGESFGSYWDRRTTIALRRESHTFESCQVRHFGTDLIRSTAVLESMLSRPNLSRASPVQRPSEAGRRQRSRGVSGFNRAPAGLQTRCRPCAQSHAGDTRPLRGRRRIHRTPLQPRAAAD